MDYIELAKLLGNAKRGNLTIDELTAELIEVLRTDNPRFDSARFLAYIEKETNKWNKHRAISA